MASATCPLISPEDTLGILDTFHDFCKSARISTAARAAGAEPDRLDVMRKYLPKLIKNTYDDGIPKDEKFSNTVDVAGVIYKITCGKLKGVSSIEHDGVEFFESNPLFNKNLETHEILKETITFDDIIEAYKQNDNSIDNELWNKYNDDLTIRSLEITKGNFDFDFEDDDASVGSNNSNQSRNSAQSGSSSKKSKDLAGDFEIISNFLLRFFFFSSTVDTYITFDAGKRMLGDIFRKTINVSNVIFPQTIADSATTSFGSLGGPNTYIFPSLTNEVEFTSNYFSTKQYRTYILNNGFDDTNPYGFSIGIKSKSNSANTIILPFSPTQTEGPSVNYLVDILKTAQDNTSNTLQYTTIKKKGTILTIGKYLDENENFRKEFEKTIRQEKNGLLPDLKRGGDHEAVLAAKFASKMEVKGEKKYQYFLFSTIDILCALRARIEGLNTIWQGPTRLILYRNIQILPDDIKIQENTLKIREIISILKKIDTLISIQLPAQIEEAENTFTEGKRCVVPFAHKNKDLQYKQRVEEMLNALLRFRMYDLEKKAIELKNKNFVQDKTQLDNLKSFLVFDTLDNESIQEQLIDNGASIMIGNDKNNIEKKLKETIDLYNKITGNIMEELNLDLKRTQDTNLIFNLNSNIITKRKDPANNVDDVFTMEDNTVFKYYPGDFTALYDVLIYINELSFKNANKPSRDYPKIMKRILSEDTAAPVQYFSVAEAVIEQFEDIEIKAKIKSILDFREELFKESQGKSTDKKDELGIQYLVGKSYIQHYKDDYDTASAFEAEEFADEGVVNKIRNYFKENSQAYYPSKKSLPFKDNNETLDYEPPPQTGGARQGIKKTDALQYYDLSDLLYEVSQKAAAFIESAYTQEYPLYALKFNLEQYKLLKDSLTTLEKIEYIKTFIALIETNKETIDKTLTTRTVISFNTEFKDIKEQFKIINSTDAGTDDELEENLKTIFDTFTHMIDTHLPQNYPKLNNFLRILDTDKKYKIKDENDTEQISSSQLYEEIGSYWQAGLFEIRQDKEYLYYYLKDERGLNTEDLITYLLTLVQNASTKLYESTLGDGSKGNEWLIVDSISQEIYKVVKKQIDKEKLEIHKKLGNISLGTYMLLYFTLIENIMNQNKYSFFLNKETYDNKIYDTQNEWDNRLYNLLKNLFLFIKLDSEELINVVKTSQGGRYSKHTRRMKKQIKGRKTRRANVRR